MAGGLEIEDFGPPGPPGGARKIEIRGYLIILQFGTEMGQGFFQVFQVLAQIGSFGVSWEGGIFGLEPRHNSVIKCQFGGYPKTSISRIWARGAEGPPGAPRAPLGPPGGPPGDPQNRQNRASRHRKTVIFRAFSSFLELPGAPNLTQPAHGNHTRIQTPDSSTGAQPPSIRASVALAITPTHPPRMIKSHYQQMQKRAQHSMLSV